MLLSVEKGDQNLCHPVGMALSVSLEIMVFLPKDASLWDAQCGTLLKLFHYKRSFLILSEHMLQNLCTILASTQALFAISQQVLSVENVVE